MTRDEIKQIIGIMASTYPNYKPDDLKMTVDVWQMMLEDFSYQQVAMALKAYIMSDTSGFAPSIGQLVGKMQMISQPNELNEMEAWALVGKAIRNGYYGAETEFAKLPEMVQKAVGQPSQLRQWAHSDMESIETVIQSNFIKTYRTVVKRESEIQRMPIEVRNMIGANSTHILIGGKDREE